MGFTFTIMIEDMQLIEKDCRVHFSLIFWKSSALWRSVVHIYTFEFVQRGQRVKLCSFFLAVRFTFTDWSDIHSYQSDQTLQLAHALVFVASSTAQTSCFFLFNGGSPFIWSNSNLFICFSITLLLVLNFSWILTVHCSFFFNLYKSICHEFIQLVSFGGVINRYYACPP